MPSKKEFNGWLLPKRKPKTGSFGGSRRSAPATAILPGLTSEHPKNVKVLGPDALKKMDTQKVSLNSQPKDSHPTSSQLAMGIKIVERPWIAIDMKDFVLKSIPIVYPSAPSVSS